MLGGLRADWQSRYNHTTGSRDVTNLILHEPFLCIPAPSELKAKLVLGEDYLASNILMAFRFIGALAI
ncbi:hypothetical protein AB6F62_00575 [Providencia huaxiensis]|uniref:hypothetical protein n=1 Tax=Providencia huaxiensis TaxID=2027290 RepID=UPI0034DD828A